MWFIEHMLYANNTLGPEHSQRKENSPSLHLEDRKKKTPLLLKTLILTTVLLFRKDLTLGRRWPLTYTCKMRIMCLMIPIIYKIPSIVVGFSLHSTNWCHFSVDVCQTGLRPPVMIPALGLPWRGMHATHFPVCGPQSTYLSKEGHGLGVRLRGTAGTAASWP